MHIYVVTINFIMVMRICFIFELFDVGFKDIFAKSEWVFGYAAGVAGLYFCYKNGETSKLREEVAEQNKFIAGLVDDVGRCGRSQSACWNLFPPFAGQVLNMKAGT